MKVLIVGEYYRPLIGWFQRDEEPTGTPAIYNLYQYLGQSEDHQFHSVIYNFDENRIKTMPNGSIIELKKLSFPIYLIWKLIAYFKLLIFLNNHLKTNEYDVIYGLSTYSSIAAFLGKKHGILSVGRIYGTILTEKLKNKRWFKIYTRHIFEILAVKNPADIMIATQDGTSFDKVAQYFNSSIVVHMMYNGMDSQYRSTLLDLDPITNIVANKKIYFCSISRIEHYKRHHLSIQVTKMLKEKYKLDVELLILGSGAMYEDIQNIITTQNLNDYVYLDAEIPHSELPDLIESYDFSFFLYEGGSLGNVMWEHALAGKTICTVNNGDTCSVFQDDKNAIVVEDSDQLVDDLSQKIYTYILKENQTLGLEARSTVEKIIGVWEDRFDKEFDMIERSIRK